MSQCHDRPQRALTQRLDSVQRLEEQELFLDVGREQGQIAELRDPRTGQPEATRRVGAIDELARFDLALDSVGQREHLCDAGRPAHRLMFGPLRRDVALSGLDTRA